MVLSYVAEGFSLLDAPALLIILLLALLIFGGKKLPELARSIGLSARELRKGLGGEETETNAAKNNVTGEAAKSESDKA